MKRIPALLVVAAMALGLLVVAAPATGEPPPCPEPVFGGPVPVDDIDPALQGEDKNGNGFVCVSRRMVTGSSPLSAYVIDDRP
jgi:hypothetical protein